MIKALVSLGLLILTISCSTKTSEVADSEVIEEVKYATGFHFEKQGNKKVLVIDKPWPNSNRKISYDLSKPLTKIVCTSTSHLPFVELLGKERTVLGFPNLQYVSSQTFIDLAAEGSLQDLGPDGNINMELLLSLDPEAVIAFDMGAESTSLDKIKESGIPVYYNSDFLETSPLGRAEWIKFFGALLGKEKQADSIFSVVEKDYLEMQSKAKNTDSSPTILSGVLYGDSWFLPGGQNWASTFFEDAGGSYIWKSDTTTGWLELSFESVYAKANDADLWIGTSTLNSKLELLGQDARYESFRAFAESNVYNYNKRVGANGGYDFFESGYARPDQVLADLISIIHPDLLTNYETVYFQQLE